MAHPAAFPSYAQPLHARSSSASGSFVSQDIRFLRGSPRVLGSFGIPPLGSFAPLRSDHLQASGGFQVRLDFSHGGFVRAVQTRSSPGVGRVFGSFGFLLPVGFVRIVSTLASFARVGSGGQERAVTCPGRPHDLPPWPRRATARARGPRLDMVAVACGGMGERRCEAAEQRQSSRL